jgi:Tfp pilus assembly protein PilF
MVAKRAAPPQADARRPLLPAALAVAALAAATYASTLGYGFVWDDPISVQRWLPALTKWWSAFFPPANIPQFPADYYRPLQLWSYQLDNAIGGGAPWAFHLDVVALHTLASVLVLLTGSRFLGAAPSSSRAALWAAALFATHPIHSESVAWMAARPDVMVTCAGLGALLAYWHQGWGAWRRAGVAAALVFIALLCKETAAALLIAVPASTAILRLSVLSSAQRRTLLTAAIVAFATAALVYLLMRAAGTESGVAPAAVLPANPLFALVGASGTYLRLLVLPHPQSAYISDLSAGGPALAISFLFLLAFAALLLWSRRRDDRALFFALAWIVITLAPSLAVIAKPATAPLAERYLYLPSVGLCWAFGLLVVGAAGHPRFGRIAQPAAAAVVLVACAATMQRNPVWRDNLSLWSDTAAKNTAAGLPLRSLAAVTLERGDAAAAEKMFEQALMRSNDAHGRHIIYNNLGTLALNRGDDESAERHYRRALTFELAADCLYNLGLIELRRALAPALAADARAEKQRTARTLFEQALAASPFDADIHMGLAHAAEAVGEPAAARRHFEEALRLGLPPTTAAAVRRRLNEIQAQN